MSGEVDVEGLRRAAEAATPGPWRRGTLRDVTHVFTEALGMDQDDTIADTLERQDAAYIAAASPDVVLALLDQLAEMRRLNRQLENDVERGLGREQMLEDEWQNTKDALDFEKSMCLHVEAQRDRLRETVARVEAACNNPAHSWWHTGGTRCMPVWPIRDALRDALDSERHTGTPDASQAAEGALSAPEGHVSDQEGDWGVFLYDEADEVDQVLSKVAAQLQVNSLRAAGLKACVMHREPGSERWDIYPRTWRDDDAQGQVSATDLAQAAARTKQAARGRVGRGEGLG